MKSFMVLCAIGLAAPAMAQTAGAPASTNAAQPAASGASQAPQPATDSPAAQGATPATPAESAASASNPADAVAQVVSTDWSKYDADSDKGLSKEEFGKWMTALREQNPAQKAQVKDTAGWTNAAFAQADKDKNGTVSQTELQSFLKG